MVHGQSVMVGQLIILVIFFNLSEILCWNYATLGRSSMKVVGTGVAYKIGRWLVRKLLDVGNEVDCLR
jgi:hypothetical protein